MMILASIYTADEANACSVWPSPEQLKGRIIIRVDRFLLKSVQCIIATFSGTSHTQE